jgi:UDP-N-acetylglucosamine diphosphorylase / glucose-1-phosphate thymidylyltransferase / UDP-N-acetylgalactosamine diphosphorylase / glucosamine-1-phosphate N-acetyltransferase / galactosamine-1-phosphate N-acetyltransferase
LIEQGSNMRGIVRLANIQLAKLLEILWWNFEGRFTDTQCVFRAIWRQSFDLIASDLKCKGGEFNTEMIIELLQKRRRIIEIPVNYQNRPGSAFRKYQNVRTYFSILFLMLSRKARHVFRPDKGV